MAVQTGLGLSRILLIVGAGYTGTIVVRNGKLSEISAELQKSGENPGTDADHSEAIASQVRRLAMEVRKRAVTQPVTVVNGSSGNMTSLIVPAAATLGLFLGYGYMWWNATKRHLTERVKNLDGELDEQKKISKEVKDEVVDACTKISKIGSELKSLQQLVSGLDTTINAIEDKQDAPKPTGKPCYSGCTDSVVKGVALAVESLNFDGPEEPGREGLSGG